MQDKEHIKSLSTIKVNPYEIAKASDLDFGFRSILYNGSVLLDAFTQSKNDFILGGNITVVPNKLEIKIAPYVAYSKKANTFYCNSNETILKFDVSNKIYDRIDVICIGGEGWVEFKNEKRAKWDSMPIKVEDESPTNTAEEMLFGEFNKRQKQNVEIIVIKGEDNNGIAKDANNAMIKIAEVEIKASREMLGIEDIHFVSALMDGEKNKEWTKEPRRTFYIAPIKDALIRYFKIHKKDGDLKDGIIKATHLALSGGDALTAMKISLGSDIIKKAGKNINGTFEYKTPFESHDKLQVQIFSQTDIKKTLDILFDDVIYLWSTFIDQGYRVYYASKKHTDTEIIRTKNEFNRKLDIEKADRKEADRIETEARIAGDTQEKKEREQAISKEKKERIDADNLERQTREKAISKERTERIDADNLERQEREQAINKEIEERIKGDEENRKLAQEAYKFSLPIGTFVESYTKDAVDGFLQLDGSVFDKDKYPLFYKYWEQHLSELGKDYNDEPYLPLVEKEDYSRLGEIVTFIGNEYHDEFLICDGSPFSPDVYNAFYEQYWKKYLSYLGTDPISGWPLRPNLNSLIAGSNIYIKVLPQIKNEWVYPFIKSGD